MDVGVERQIHGGTEAYQGRTVDLTLLRFVLKTKQKKGREGGIRQGMYEDSRLF